MPLEDELRIGQSQALIEAIQAMPQVDVSAIPDLSLINADQFNSIHGNLDAATRLDKRYGDVTKCPFIRSMGNAGIELGQKIKSSMEGAERGPTLREAWAAARVEFMQSQKLEEATKANMFFVPKETKNKEEIVITPSLDVAPIRQAVIEAIRRQADKGPTPAASTLFERSMSVRDKTSAVSEERSAIIKTSNTLVKTVDIIQSEPIAETLVHVTDTTSAFDRVVPENSDTDLSEIKETKPEVVTELGPIEESASEEILVNTKVVSDIKKQDITESHVADILAAHNPLELVKKSSKSMDKIGEIPPLLNTIDSIIPTIQLAAEHTDTDTDTDTVTVTDLAYEPTFSEDLVMLETVEKTPDQKPVFVLPHAEFESYVKTLEPAKVELVETALKTVMHAIDVAVKEHSIQFSEQGIETAEIEKLCVTLLDSLGLKHDKKMILTLLNAALESSSYSGAALNSAEELNNIGTHEHKFTTLMTSLMQLIKDKVEPYIRLGRFALSSSASLA